MGIMAIFNIVVAILLAAAMAAPLTPGNLIVVHSGEGSKNIICYSAF
jgi:hypothetical protein